MRVLSASALALAATTLLALAAPRALELRAQAVSGAQQSATAYVVSNAPRYLTEFPELLVVRVPGAPPGDDFRIRFHCVTPGCTLVPADQPHDGDNVERIDRTAYKAKLVKGLASIRISVESTRPDAVYTVRAEPIVRNPGERADAAATFTLISR